MHARALLSPPVIFTPADRDRRAPLYRLLVQPSGETLDFSGFESPCGEALYRNPDAVVITYRAPNRHPLRNAVVVQKCFAGAGGSN